MKHKTKNKGITKKRMKLIFNNFLETIQSHGHLIIDERFNDCKKSDPIELIRLIVDGLENEFKAYKPNK